MRCAERVVRHRAACTVPPIVEGDLIVHRHRRRGRRGRRGRRLWLRGRLCRRRGRFCRHGGCRHAVRRGGRAGGEKGKGCKNCSTFFHNTYLIQRSLVGAAHVRPVAVWQTTSCGKAAGRALVGAQRAPTVCKQTRSCGCLPRRGKHCSRPGFVPLNRGPTLTTPQCPAPTVRQIVGGAVRIGLRGVGDAAPYLYRFFSCSSSPSRGVT